MTFEERSGIADDVWRKCQIILASLFTTADIMTPPGKPKRLNKHTKDSAMISIRPEKKLPNKFWGGITWYQIHVGSIPNKVFPNLNLGSVEFQQSYKREASGDGAYYTATLKVLRIAEQSLGSKFRINETEEHLSLGCVYRESVFPTDDAAKDLANLIFLTLPLLQQIPSR